MDRVLNFITKELVDKVIDKIDINKIPSKRKGIEEVTIAESTGLTLEEVQNLKVRKK